MDTILHDNGVRFKVPLLDAYTVSYATKPRHLRSHGSKDDHGQRAAPTDRCAKGWSDLNVRHTMCAIQSTDKRRSVRPNADAHPQ